MIESLKNYIREHKLFNDDQKILLTVSGGIDSMVMLHLFKQLNISFAVAHCNFQLRGIESEEDEVFVRTSVEILGVPYFIRRFETKQYAADNKLSIQMAARELRYTWFEKLRRLHQYDYIATAHNSDDSIETFFINLTRGCGLDGLTGIKPMAGNIIRPLLFASRKDIEYYARRKGVNYREDSSNSSDKYLRNFIRLQVLPLMEQAAPAFRKSVLTSISNLSDSHSIYEQSIDNIIAEVTHSEGNILFIDIPKLSRIPSITTILWEILNKFQFNRDSCQEIGEALTAQSGKIFFSSTHRLVKDRDKLIVTPIPGNEKHSFYIDLENVPSNLPINLKFELVENTSGYILPRTADVVALDYDLISFPLIMRTWRSGDYFCPLGMIGLKKVSDFLIDLKISVPEKENTWLLESAGKIIWILRKRIDDRFKVTENTKKILLMEVVPS